MAHRPHLFVRRLLRQRPRPWLACGLALLTTVVLVDAIFGEAGYFARLRARAQYARHADRLAAIRHDNLMLRQRTRRLGEDPAAIEETAREELGMLRRGEILFRIKDQPATLSRPDANRASQGATAQ